MNAHKIPFADLAEARALFARRGGGVLLVNVRVGQARTRHVTATTGRSSRRCVVTASVEIANRRACDRCCSNPLRWGNRGAALKPSP